MSTLRGGLRDGVAAAVVVVIGGVGVGGGGVVGGVFVFAAFLRDIQTSC